MKTTSKFARFLLVILVCLMMVASLTLAQEGSPVATEDARLNQGLFPFGLYCSESTLGPGPEWFELEVGKTTVEDLITVNHLTIDPSSINDGDPSEILVSGGPFGSSFVQLCIKNATVSSVSFYIDFYKWPFKDFLLRYGVPDQVTYAPQGRVAFWFEYGLAVEIHRHSKRVEDSFGVYFEPLPFDEGIVGSVILFPFQDPQEGLTQWPFIYAPTISMHGAIGDVIYEEEESPQNPFNFDAMFATATAQATLTPLGSELSYTPMPSTATLAPTATCLEGAC